MLLSSGKTQYSLQQIRIQKCLCAHFLAFWRGAATAWRRWAAESSKWAHLLRMLNFSAILHAASHSTAEKKIIIIFQNGKNNIIVELWYKYKDFTTKEERKESHFALQVVLGILWKRIFYVYQSTLKYNFLLLVRIWMLPPTHQLWMHLLWKSHCDTGVY